MARVPYHDLETAPGQSRDGLKQISEEYGGTISNIFGAMAESPAYLHLFLNAEGALREFSSLDERTRQAIHLTVSAVNDCHYCQSAYTMAAERAGFDRGETVKIRAGEVDFDDDLARLLDLVREASENEGYVDDATWDAALAAGWDRSQLLDALADAVRTFVTNYFNHIVGTELDLPEAPEIR